MRIGYSFWGFLGNGITDTPDGGRSHRRTLVDGILHGLHHEIVFLQPNRDLTEAQADLSAHFSWDAGLPDVDLIFLEWRWPIPGRNTTPCDSPGHTCDLHRQSELLRHYTVNRRVPTVVWDKDLQLPEDHPIRGAANVQICEAGFHPGPRATSLLFPVSDRALNEADPDDLTRERRSLPLVYVGNQYGRDEAFDRFFAPVAASCHHQVAGKWTDTSRWPHIRFTGRVPFPTVEKLHRSALATMLLTPDRLARRAQFTQRIFEAALSGCLPLAPSDLRSVERVVPAPLLIDDAAQARKILSTIALASGGELHAELLAGCLRRLEPFRLSHQLGTLQDIFDRMTGRTHRAYGRVSPGQ